MGYLNKTTQTVTAHFTKRGREILANALSGATDGSYVITQFALGDDEIDYGLWDETQPANLQGRVIENMPLLESFINQQEIMNSFIIDPPDIPLGSVISNVQSEIQFEGANKIVDIIPSTDNFGDIEEYEFVILHDNLFEISELFTSPVTDFNMAITPLDPPESVFTMTIPTPDGNPPMSNFDMFEI